MDKNKIYFFTRIGGKRKIANEIINYFPYNYNIYIEPFAGSAQIFLALKKNDNTKYILNDIDLTIYSMWIDIKKVKKDDLFEFNWEGNKFLYDFLKTKEYDNHLERLYKNLYINFYSYSGDFNSGFCKKKSIRGKGFFKTFDLLQKKIKNTKIFNKDYKYIIEKYDNQNALFYIDPPYLNKGYLYNNLSINPTELKNVLVNIKGKFILSYNNNEIIKKIFKNYKIYEIDVPYTSTNKKYIKKELLIMNF